MAKKKRPAGRLLTFFQRLAGDAAPAALAQTRLGTDTHLSISSQEQEDIVARCVVATRGPQQTRRGDSYTKYIQPMARQIAERRLDAAAIEELAPEVKKAKEIVIPSIISPSDMRDGEITLKSTSSLATASENDKISSVLNAHFNGTLKLSTKLPNWIHEGLYGAGSKPILVLPVTEIDTIINDPDAVLSKTKVYAANEALDSRAVDSIYARLQRIETTSILGFADRPALAVKPPEPGSIEHLRPAVEAAVETHIRNTIAIQPETPRSYDRSKVWSNAVTSKLQEFSASALEQLNIVDNPDLLKTDKARKRTKTAEITARLVNVYKMAPLITVNPETKPSVDNPIVIELPPESVIPIFTPGTPSDHIGYFILLDEFGNPVHITEDSQNLDLNDNRQVTPAALYKSFGFNDGGASKGGGVKAEQTALMMNVYQTIVEAHLKNRLKDSGLSNIYIGAPSSVYRCMFARYLALRKTRLLFVPRDLMSYLCFRYNDDGTGRSKIEDIKFILSLKITILVSRVMVSMNAAINRKKIGITFTENMGDPIAFMQTVEKEVMDKMMTNFTYDPVEVTRSIAQRSLTVEPKGIPGIEQFAVTTEPNEYRGIKPDESLMEDLNNMMILGLDVPPSAYNQLGDNEFSRSVATNDLFFSRRIAAYQKPVCEHVAHHARIYTQMSAPLKEAISAILSAGSGQAAAETVDAGTHDDKPVSLAAKLADVIKNITATLPAPNIAPSKTEFEELNAIISAVSTALEAVFDDAIGAADQNPIGHIRSLIKSDIVRDYMTKIGAARDVTIPDLSDPTFIKRLFDSKQNILNLQAGLQAAKAVTQTADAEVPSGTGGQPF